MTEYQNGTTLTDAKGMGGVIAQDGFDYQVWDAIVRLPDWLLSPAFEGLISEGLEDLEARFFAPHAPHGHFLNRYQAKSGTLTKGELVKVFNSFLLFDKKFPKTARMHALVTPALPKELEWIGRDSSRVDRARPFYQPFPDLFKVSEQKLREDLVKEFGAEVGGFYADFIDVELRVFPDRATAEAMFSSKMLEAFPDLNFNPRRFATVFTALFDLIAGERGALLSKKRLVAVMEEAFGHGLLLNENLCIHLRSSHDHLPPGAIEIDATQFSGLNGLFPPSQTWMTHLVPPLQTAANWAREREHKRIKLSGGCRLSTAFTVGWSFRSGLGFDLNIPAGSGVWATDEHPVALAQQPAWAIHLPQGLVNGRLVVSIGVLRDPKEDVKTHLGLSEDKDLLIATLSTPLAAGAEAQASVQAIKSAVAQAVSRFQPAGIDLFFVGPAALATALGHRWNALPSTQLYEFIVSDRRYVPTIVLGN